MTQPDDEPAVTTDDPIVAEVRARRDSLAASVNYDLDALVARLQKLEDAERKAGRTILPPSGKPGAAA
jgi:hypothetical protein